METVLINGKSVPVLAHGADWSAAQLSGAVVSQPVNDRPDGTGRWYNLSFTLRYADFVGQSHAPLTKSEHASHRAAGLRSWLIFQKTTRDPDGGRARGEAFGREALAYAKKIEYKGEFIAFTADAPAGSYDLPTAVEFFKGAQAVVNAAGLQCCVYGFWDVIYACMDAHVGDLYWLCGAMSRWRPGIHLYQYNNGRVYPAQVEADLCMQFMEIGGPPPLPEEEMASLLVRTHDDPTVFRVTWSADGCWKSEVGSEYDLLIASGVKVWIHNQINVDQIPTRSDNGRAVWNYYLPTGGKNDKGEDEYVEAHKLLTGVSVRVHEAVADIDEVALAAALKAQGVPIGTTPVQVKQAVIDALRQGTGPVTP